MTIDKLISLLNAHGIIFYRLDNIIHAYVYSDSKEYDVLTISYNNKFICNGKQSNVLEWLGY